MFRSCPDLVQFPDFGWQRLGEGVEPSRHFAADAKYFTRTLGRVKQRREYLVYRNMKFGQDWQEGGNLTTYS